MSSLRRTVIASSEPVPSYACSGRIDGIELSFDTGITTIDQTADIAQYKSTLPDEIRYNQRREFHRVPPHREISVKIRTPQGRSLESKLRDISLGGVCVQSATSTPTGWLRHGEAMLCDMPIGRNSSRVVSPIEICHVRQQPHNRTQLIGARFTGLDPLQRRHIQRYIANIERDLVKRGA